MRNEQQQQQQNYYCRNIKELIDFSHICSPIERTMVFVFVFELSPVIVFLRPKIVSITQAQHKLI